MDSDDASSAALDRVWALVSRETVSSEDQPHLVGRLQRLCRAAATALPATGVGISVMSRGSHVTFAASNADHARVEELQFILGEGPCLEAYDSRRPVLMPDLALAARTRWPGYAPAAQDHGVRAVFAFPLQVGAARLGALDVYQDRPGPLVTVAVQQALAFADVAMQTLLDAQRDTGTPDGSGEPGEDAMPPAEVALAGRLELYQAQGMVMVQLGVTLDEAMVRMRAYAYAHNRRIHDVAADIVARRLVLEGDGHTE